jgi:hypothetical protein
MLVQTVQNDDVIYRKNSTGPMDRASCNNSFALFIILTLRASREFNFNMKLKYEWMMTRLAFRIVLRPLGDT